MPPVGQQGDHIIILFQDLVLFKKYIVLLSKKKKPVKPGYSQRKGSRWPALVNFPSSEFVWLSQGVQSQILGAAEECA